MIPSVMSQIMGWFAKHPMFFIILFTIFAGFWMSLHQYHKGYDVGVHDTEASYAHRIAMQAAEGQRLALMLRSKTTALTDAHRRNEELSREIANLDDTRIPDDVRERLLQLDAGPH